MNTIQTAYINALLADASYAKYEGTVDSLAMKARLTASQSAFLAANFEVLNSIETPGLLGSGFDAVVWRIKADSELARQDPANAGKVFVSMRGTQGLEDIADDILLATTGVPKDQIVAMVNWWLRITAPATATTVQQIQYSTVTTTDPITGAVTNTGTFLLASPIARTGPSIDVSSITGVNGHSLGGYLATTFTRLFGNQFGVQAVSTFNSAGFSNVAANSTIASFNQIAQLLGLTGSFSEVGAKQTNYYAQNGWSLTNNTWGEMGFLMPGFMQYGQRAALWQEEGLGVANHSMYKQTDLLALGAALEKLDSSMTFAKLNELIKAGSNDMKASYEGVLDGLRKALAGPNAQALPVGDISDSATSRVTYHATLAALQNNPIFKDLAGQLNIKLASNDVRAAARNDFGALIALQDLSPLYIGGKTSAANSQLTEIWQIARATDYAAWQLDKTMSVADRQLGKETFSDQWLSDRAALLQAIAIRNKQDNTSGLVYDLAAPAGQVTLFQWYGAEPLAGQTLPGLATLSTSKTGVSGLPDQFTAFGDSGSNLLDGTNNGLGDRLYGGDGADILNGLAGSDYLEGNAGDDTLNGGLGNDKLYGGAGDDTYNFTGNWGTDTIVDAGGQGQIRIDGTPLVGGKKIAGLANTWHNTDQGYTFTLDGTGTSQILSITKQGSLNTIRIQGWQNNQLGLTMDDTPAADPVIDRTYSGDQRALLIGINSDAACDCIGWSRATFKGRNRACGRFKRVNLIDRRDNKKADGVGLNFKAVCAEKNNSQLKQAGARA